MTSPRGQANGTAIPPNQKVNKAEELTYLSMCIVATVGSMVANIDRNLLKKDKKPGSV
jgi:hypothetical protein